LKEKKKKQDDSLCTTNLFKGGAEKQISTRTIHATASSAEMQQKKLIRDKHPYCTYPNCNRLKLKKKKKTIMRHVSTASLQVKSKEKKGEHH
jgi:hypothetical protein